MNSMDWDCLTPSDLLVSGWHRELNFQGESDLERTLRFLFKDSWVLGILKGELGVWLPSAPHMLEDTRTSSESYLYRLFFCHFKEKIDTIDTIKWNVHMNDHKPWLCDLQHELHGCCNCSSYLRHLQAGKLGFQVFSCSLLNSMSTGKAIPNQQHQLVNETSMAHAQRRWR